MTPANVLLSAEVLIEDIGAIDRIDWLRARQQGIGGSDAAAALGLSPWTSQTALYYDKIDPVRDDEGPERWKRGRQLEGVIADMLLDETAGAIINAPVMLRSRRYPFMLYSPDRFIDIPGDHGHNIETNLVEVKNVDRFAADQWDAGPPLHYRLQCLHGLVVTGLDVCWLAALLGGNKFVAYRIERDEEMIASLIAREEAFWSLVMLQRPPEADGSESTSAALARHYNSPEEMSTVEVGPEILQYFLRRNEAQMAKRAAELQITEIDNHLKALIGNHEAATLDGDVVATWKTVERAGYEVKPTSFRQINIPKRKAPK